LRLPGWHKADRQHGQHCQCEEGQRGPDCGELAKLDIFHSRTLMNRWKKR